MVSDTAVMLVVSDTAVKCIVISYVYHHVKKLQNKHK